jgi:hypothetical protein
MEETTMFHWQFAFRPGSAIASTAILTIALLGGCQASEPDKKITYTPVPGAADSQVRGTGPAAAGSQPGQPVNPMNDPDLASKGQDILKRTGGDVNKMTEAEKKTFMEAAKNGHL